MTLLFKFYWKIRFFWQTFHRANTSISQNVPTDKIDAFLLGYPVLSSIDIYMIMFSLTNSVLLWELSWNSLLCKNISTCKGRAESEFFAQMGIFCTKSYFGGFTNTLRKTELFKRKQLISANQSLYRVFNDPTSYEGTSKWIKIFTFYNNYYTNAGQFLWQYRKCFSKYKHFTYDCVKKTMILQSNSCCIAALLENWNGRKSLFLEILHS